MERYDFFFFFCCRLAYLHEAIEPKVVHRDIKSSNILIDDDFNCKISDFGLAKLLGAGKSHITTRVMGTFGLVFFLSKVEVICSCIHIILFTLLYLCWWPLEEKLMLLVYKRSPFISSYISLVLL